MKGFSTKTAICVFLTLTLRLTLVYVGACFQYHQDKDLDGKLFTENVLFDTESGKSIFECSRLCAHTSHCLAFTFYEEVKCRGHNVVLNTSRTSGARINATIYIAGWSQYLYISYTVLKMHFPFQPANISSGHFSRLAN